MSSVKGMNVCSEETIEEVRRCLLLDGCGGGGDAPDSQQLQLRLNFVNLGGQPRSVSIECMRSLVDALERTTLVIDEVSFKSSFFELLLIHTNNNNNGGATATASATATTTAIATATAEEVKICLLKAIGNLPHLNYLYWLVGGNRREDGDNGRRSLQYLSTMLKEKNSGLKRLKCTRAYFTGTVQDFEDFADALRDHPSLEEIRFSFCDLSESCQTAIYINPVLKALRSIPNLSSLDPNCWGIRRLNDDETTLAALTDLYSHPKLKQLNFCFTYARLEPILEAASSTTTTLQSLTLRIPLQEEEECTKLVRIIRECRSLDTLQLRNQVDQEEDEDEEEVQNAFIKVVQALQHNNSIKQFRYAFRTRRTYFSPSQDCLEAIVSMLKTNMTLREIKFETNWSWYDKYPNLTDTTWYPSLVFWLTLNRAGRKELVQQQQMASTTTTTTSTLAAAAYNNSHNNDNKWIEILIKLSNISNWDDDILPKSTLPCPEADPGSQEFDNLQVSVIYYLLSHRPYLCCHGGRGRGGGEANNNDNNLNDNSNHHNNNNNNNNKKRKATDEVAAAALDDEDDEQQLQQSPPPVAFVAKSLRKA